MQYLLPLLLIISMLAAGCRHGASTSAQLPAGDTVTARAALLTVVERPDWVEATVADPWKAGRVLGRYALVPRDSDVTVPDGFTRVGVPLRRSIVYSAVHTSAISELGAADAIAGVADGSYLPDSDPLRRALNDGRVRDIGSSMSPSLETAIDIAPDAILLSPYENGSTGGIDKAGAPVVEMADYMEMEPTARAEWIILLGYLYGKPELARTIYNQVCARYDSIASATSARSDRPQVFTERLTSGVWYVPGGKSYMARLLADAGADYLWSDTDVSGSLTLDEAAVLDRAADADYWLLKEFSPMTAARLLAELPRAGQFRAFPAGVRVCDTRHSSLFNDIAFHPERVLADLAAMFGGAPADSAIYYKPLQ